MYFYCYANVHRLVPSYRQIGIFPDQLEKIDLPRMDANWIVRLLEEAVMILLDIYTPSEKPKLRNTTGYSEEMYLETLGECRIPHSVFHPLNQAMPYHSNNGACKCEDSRS